jgi:hypothetical protein
VLFSYLQNICCEDNAIFISHLTLIRAIPYTILNKFDTYIRFIFCITTYDEDSCLEYLLFNNAKCEHVDDGFENFIDKYNMMIEFDDKSGDNFVDKLRLKLLIKANEIIKLKQKIKQIEEASETDKTASQDELVRLKKLLQTLADCNESIANVTGEIANIPDTYDVTDDNDAAFLNDDLPEDII